MELQRLLVRALAVCALLSGAALLAAAEMGDEQLAQAFEAAYVELAQSSTVLTDWFTANSQTAFQSCFVNTTYYAYPTKEAAKGVLQQVLNSGTLKVATYSKKQATVVPFSYLTTQFSTHYGVAITVAETACDTEDACFRLLDNRDVDVIDSSFGVGGSADSHIRRLYWRPLSCAMGVETLLLGSTSSSGISSAASLNTVSEDKVLLSETADICAFTDYQQQLLSFAFSGLNVRLLSSESDCTSLVLSDPDVLATVLSEDTSRLVTYKYKMVVPLAPFFRRETQEKFKVNRGAVLQSYETGNEELAQMYDAAYIEQFTSGYVDKLFDHFSIDHDVIGDCLLQNKVYSYKYLEASVGTLNRIKTDKKVTIGVVKADNMPLLSTVGGTPKGIIVSLEKTIFNWIATQFSMYSMNVTYKIYDSQDEVFDALDNGEIDVTSALFFTGGFGMGYRRNLEYRPSCTIMSQPSVGIVRTSSGINNLEGLSIPFIFPPAKKVGVQSPQMVDYFKQLHIGFQQYAEFTVNSNIDALFSLLRTDSSTWVVFPDPPFTLDTTKYPDFTTITLGQSIPNAAFFRQDKVFPCYNNEVEPEYGEECDAGIAGDVTGSGCSNCSCNKGYHSTSPESTVCAANHNGGKANTAAIVLGTVFGVLGAVVVLAIIIVIIVMIIIVKTRSYDDEEEYVNVLVDSLDHTSKREKFDDSNSTETPTASLPLLLSTDLLEFGHHVDPAPVAEPMTQVINIKNLSPKAHYTFHWYFTSSSPKYDVQFEPQEDTIDPGDETDVTLTLNVACTTHLKDTLVFAICEGSEWKQASQHSLVHIELDSKQSTKLDPDEFSMAKEPIGDGAFGRVYKGNYRGQDVAIKVLKNQDHIDRQFQADFKHEVDTMDMLRCPYIVSFVGACHMIGRMAIVTEFLELGNMRKAMSENQFPLRLKVKCMLDIAKGMEFIHKSNVLHRDLKPDNILMASLSGRAAVNCKLTDFGTARTANLTATAQYYTKNVGTPLYMAPEIHETEKYTTSADVFSYAVLSWQLLSEHQPYVDAGLTTAHKIAEFVCSGQRLEIPDLDADITDIVSRCWAHEPTDRPQFAQVAQELEPVVQRYQKAKKHHGDLYATDGGTSASMLNHTAMSCTNASVMDSRMSTPDQSHYSIDNTDTTDTTVDHP
eukprot:TRINITY_DN7775_c0_g1_i1.p1 TRINITY_DN7775_c0_g1~~TRINITY_DN7775_c0_g1_i1.p1  ORF type:complete len:1157 (+),score=303.07 TRINITY_DN7775_c0_g1_i1:133-3603(+)